MSKISNSISNFFNPWQKKSMEFRNEITNWFYRNSEGMTTYYYKQKSGKEFFGGKYFYRSRSLFSWIKYSVLKLNTQNWTEIEVRINSVSEKILVKREDEKSYLEIKLGGKQAFFKSESQK